MDTQDMEPQVAPAMHVGAQVAVGREDLRERGDKFLEAMNDISSEAVLPNGLKVNYRAGHEVHLTPGFHAASGVHFHAFIHPCDVPGNSFHAKSMTISGNADDEDVPMRQSSLQLYPNPATGFFTIHADFIRERGTATVRVYGSTGNLVLSSTMQGPEERLDASSLHGLFMVLVEGQGIHKVGKIVLQ